jgi:hypothetical protein
MSNGPSESATEKPRAQAGLKRKDARIGAVEPDSRRDLALSMVKTQSRHQNFSHTWYSSSFFQVVVASERWLPQFCG